MWMARARRSGVDVRHREVEVAHVLSGVEMVRVDPRA
jgi:hypothetical protein